MFELPETGDLTIDKLQQSQIMADLLPRPELKIAQITDTIHFIGAVLLGNQLMISAHNFFIKEPDAPPQDRIFMPNEMLFVAELNSYNYMIDPDIPIDSLILDFENPEVFNVDPADATRIRQTSFQVPILAIETCMAA